MGAHCMDMDTGLKISRVLCVDDETGLVTRHVDPLKIDKARQEVVTEVLRFECIVPVLEGSRVAGLCCYGRLA